MQPTRTLPDGYRLTRIIDLKKDIRLAIGLNIAAFLFLIPTAVVLLQIVRASHPGFVSDSGRIVFSGSTFLHIVGVIVAISLVLIVHELVHGLFFWIATRTRPKFGFQLTYAYAAAPDWYIPVRFYWWIGIAPFLLLGIIGILWLIVAPEFLLLYLVVAIAMNTAGSIGDLWILYTLFLQPAGCLVNDRGDGISFYIPDRTV
jgi:hypothetical protein